MRSIVTCITLLCIAGAALAQNISTVYETTQMYHIVWSNNSETWTQKNSDSRYNGDISAWVAGGGVIQPQPGPTQAEIKAVLRERIEAKVARWLALQRLKDKLTAASKPALAGQVQTLMDDVDADIDALIAQW